MSMQEIQRDVARLSVGGRGVDRVEWGPGEGRQVCQNVWVELQNLTVL